MKLLGKKLYRIRPIKLSKGGFGTGGGPMDLSNILPPAPPPLGERAKPPEGVVEDQSWTQINDGGMPPQEPISKIVAMPAPADGPGTPGWKDHRNNPANANRRQRTTYDPNGGRPGVGKYEDLYDDAKWGWDYKTGKHTGDAAAQKAYDPGGINADQWIYSDDGQWNNDPVQSLRPPGQPKPPGFVDEPEFGFEMPNNEPGFEIVPPKGPVEDQFGPAPVEEIQWGAPPLGNHGLVEKPSPTLPPGVVDDSGDTGQPGLSNWLSPIDDGRVDAPGYVEGGGGSPQPSPGAGAGEIESLRAQIKQLQATIAELRSKQQPTSKPPEQAPRPEMPMGGGGFWGRQ
jgi:hypothetical protein